MYASKDTYSVEELPASSSSMTGLFLANEPCVGADAIARAAGQWFLVDGGTGRLLMSPLEVGGLQELMHDPTLALRGVAVRSTLEIRLEGTLEVSAARLSARLSQGSWWSGLLVLCILVMVSLPIADEMLR